MNASLSDGNENVIDIFILSANSPLSSQLEKQLRDEGYYVTLFSDGTHLLETLRNGKPNLLMCDTTVPDAEAFEVCRQIKADDYLWNIPVLIITAASDLGDLLRVLDSNADNFIAHPFDPSYLLSLIEGTLVVPVERPTPDQIKTQFKIRHEDEVFVITADRRKLLEFLLSSFEIAVSKSKDLSRAQENIQNLGITIRKLEENIHENSRVIGIINETLKTKEQKLAELTGLLSDREQTIREKIAALDQVSRDFSEEKTAHAEAQAKIQQVLKEQDEASAAHQAAIDQLQQQVSDLSSELAIVKPALERANGELARESSQRQETEIELGTIAAKKEQAETALASLNTEYEQLKINFDGEKNRAQEALQELNAVLLAKTQSEQDLTGIINDLKTTAKEQAAQLIHLKEEQESEIARLKEEQESEITRLKEEHESELASLKEELASERTRVQQTEENLNAVTAAKEKSEAWLQSAIDAGQKDLVSLQAQLDRARSLLEEKEQEIKTLTDESAKVSEARNSAEQELASVSRILAETNAALGGRKKDILELEARLNTARSQVDEKEQTITTLNAEIATLRASRKSQEDELASVSRLLAETNAALGDRKKDILELEARLNTARSQAEEKEQTITTLNAEIATLRASRKSQEDELASVSRLLADTKTALEAETQNTAARKEDLARVSLEKEKADARAESLSLSLKELQDQLVQEKSRFHLNEERMSALILQRDKELSELRQVHEEVRTTVTSHETSLEQMKRELDAAISARTELEGKLQLAEEKIRQVSQDLESESGRRAEERQQFTGLADQLERVKTSLEQETLRRQESEDQLREALSQQQQLEQDLERFVSETKTLHAGLTAEQKMHEAAKNQIRSLEEQVSALSREKVEAEQAAADLKAEIDAARVALADEPEDHMTDNERHAADAGTRPQSGPPAFPGVKKEAEIIKKRSLIVKGTNTPAEIRLLPRSMVAIDPAKVSEPERSQIKSVEDLFEDDEDDKNQRGGGSPVVSIIEEPAGEPVRDVLPDAIPDRSEEQESFFEDEESPFSGPANTLDKDKTDDEDSISDGSDAVLSGQNITFNRSQWLDLLKWSHHCDALSPDQRMQIVRMGRLIQKGRKLTRRQEEQVLEMVALVQRLGYHIP